MAEGQITKGVLLEELGKFREHFDDRLDRDRDERNERIDKVEDRTLRRLDSIDSHLKTLNGQVGKLTVEAAREAQKVRSLEKTVFSPARAFGRRQGDAAGAGEGWATAFTKREYGLMLGGFSVIAAGFKVFGWLLDKLWYVLTTGVHLS